MYSTGNGMAQNYSKAVELFNMITTSNCNLGSLELKATDKGNSFAVTNLAGMYKNGKGVQQDYIKGIELYNIVTIFNCNLGSLELKAIDKRNPSPAMNNLAWMYKNGEGVQ